MKFHIDHPVIIIGMHRSGTTLLSKILDDSGIFQGVMKDHNNEAFHFLSLNQTSLKNAGADWLHPKVPQKQHWELLDKYALYAEHFKLKSGRPIKMLLLSNKQWGWKDPRNTYTLPMWLSVFPKAKVIHMVRNGVDVALSLQTRNKQKGEVHNELLNDLNYNFGLWEKYVSQGESAKALTSNYYELKYEDLLSQNNDSILGMEDFLGVNIKKGLGIIKEGNKRFIEYSVYKELTDKSEMYQKWYGEG